MSVSPEHIAGIRYLSPVSPGFERAYLEVRAKENRVYTTEQVRSFPYPAGPLPPGQLWEMRAATAEKIARYFNHAQPPKKVLDIGCGNGWFSNFISPAQGITSVTGLDINEHELKQAAEAFGDNPKLAWVYADLFRADLPLRQYDYITLNACVQYFPDLAALISRLRELLAPGGEIHILDSPFFRSDKTRKQSMARSLAYYTRLGHPEMAKSFTPHLWSEVKKYPYRILYRPSVFSSALRRMKLGRLIPASNPYCWICIRP